MYFHPGPAKSGGIRPLKAHGFFFSFPPQYRHVFLLACGYQLTGELIKISNAVPAFVFVQLFAPLPGDEKEPR